MTTWRGEFKARIGRNHFETCRKGETMKGAGPAPTGGRPRLWRDNTAVGTFPWEGWSLDPRQDSSAQGSREGICCQRSIQQWKVAGLLSVEKRQGPLEIKSLFLRDQSTSFLFLATHLGPWQRVEGVDWTHLRRIWSGRHWGETRGAVAGIPISGHPLLSEEPFFLRRASLSQGN